jgi:hypothetical protein
MRAKLVYSAPVGVSDTLDEPVTDPQVLAALADICCLEGTVLEYLDTRLPEQEQFRGGYLRLALEGKRLRVRIEIDSPRQLKKTELVALRGDLDGQVSDGIGEGAFDFIGEVAPLSVVTFPEDGPGRSTLVQTSGDSWRPARATTEAAANRRRCRAAARAATAAERAADERRAKKRGAKPNPKQLFRLLGAGDRTAVAAEVAKLGGDLSFIKSGQLPFDLLQDRPVLRILLDAGLDPNLHDRDGHSLLWLAVGSAPCLSLLLDRGADVDLRNTEVYEETALMRAAGLAHAASVRVLLARGADPRLKDYFGTTVLSQAREADFGNRAQVIRMLKTTRKK